MLPLHAGKSDLALQICRQFGSARPWRLCQARLCQASSFGFSFELSESSALLVLGASLAHVRIVSECYTVTPIQAVSDTSFTDVPNCVLILAPDQA